MNTMKKVVVAAATILGSSFMLSTHAMAVTYGVDFVDNGHYTTDLDSSLDWLDVTISVSQTYKYVSSQFGVAGEYEDWRYATEIEFNDMISNWTGTKISNTAPSHGHVRHPEGVIDGLHLLLGSTLDTGYIRFSGGTYDSLYGYAEGELWDVTAGLIADTDISTGNHWVATIFDFDRYPEDVDYTDSKAHLESVNSARANLGSYLVRETSPVPVPAAVWLMGTGLLGLMGYSRKKNTQVAS